jgi:DNA mismatch repair protein MutS2
MFSPGDRVHFAGLGTGVVIETRGRGRYAVDIKGRVIVAATRDLQHADAGRAARSRSAASEHADADADESARPGPAIDLHGKSTEDAIALVESFINDALIAGHAEVRIVHGRGSGRVKTAVHRYLRQLATTASFRLDPRNPGVTIVHFA